MRRLAQQDGFSIMEVTLSMALIIVILGATLTTFVTFNNNENQNQIQNEQQDAVRIALDHETRQLRNLADPAVTSGAVVTGAIDLASSYDFIFQTADPSKRRVRYCLNTTDNGATASAGQLIMQATSASTSLTGAMTSSCPGTGWTSTEVVSSNVTNKIGGQNRPLFYFGCSTGVTCPNTSDYSTVTSVRDEVFVDKDPARPPTESKLVSGVFLRNQNQKPTATFTYVVTGNQIQFNASDSNDPEGRTLLYEWFSGNGAIGSSTVKKIGTGVVFTYNFPSCGSPTCTRYIQLRVTDPGGLPAIYPANGPQIITTT